MSKNKPASKRRTHAAVRRAMGVDETAQLTCWYLSRLCEYCGQALATDGARVWCVSYECKKREAQDARI